MPPEAIASLKPSLREWLGAFHDPTREGLSGLWDRGVRWLYADTASSPVSPRLGRLADEVYRDGTATVYRLRRP